jgi:CBS domain-containing protein
MPIIDHQGVLKGLKVQDAMRRLVVQVPQHAVLQTAIRNTIKYKVNAILVTGDDRAGLGVVSKTDLMAAFFAGLPLDTPVAAIMVGPPLSCRVHDSLDAALDVMRVHQVHRLYVAADHALEPVGVLAYPDIVGMLYRFCNKCERNLLWSKSDSAQPSVLVDRFRLREVMTPGVHACAATDTLLAVMEALAAHRFGALVIGDADHEPVGVLSKTDLMRAYLHGMPGETPAAAVMSSPVHACDQEEVIIAALRKMIASDIHRIFVFKGEPRQLVGVFSLSDAARIRSGTCRACVASRIKLV